MKIGKDECKVLRAFESKESLRVFFAPDGVKFKSVRHSFFKIPVSSISSSIYIKLGFFPLFAHVKPTF